MLTRLLTVKDTHGTNFRNHAWYEFEEPLSTTFEKVIERKIYENEIIPYRG